MAANPARGELNMIVFLFLPCPCSRLRIWPRETGFGRPVPRQPAHSQHPEAVENERAALLPRAFRDYDDEGVFNTVHRRRVSIPSSRDYGPMVFPAKSPPAQ